MRIFIFYAMLSLAILPAAATAQENYPARPITLVLPYAAGGVADLMARVLAESMRETHVHHHERK
jgi:tripartite-type tricarboxylate transporter receptor subunit TctC